MKNLKKIVEDFQTEVNSHQCDKTIGTLIDLIINYFSSTIKVSPVFENSSPQKLTFREEKVETLKNLKFS